MFLKISEFKEIGFFDENIFIYLEEIDLCKRLKKKIRRFILIQVLKYFIKAAALMMKLSVLKWSFREIGTGCGLNFTLIKNIEAFSFH